MPVVSAKITYQDDGTVTVLWEGLANGDTGSPVDLGRHTDRTVQVVGAFGTGGDVDMEGSNDSGTTWGQLSDAQGTAISIGDNVPILIGPSTQRVRPNVANGDGTTDLDVYLIAATKGP